MRNEGSNENSRGKVLVVHKVERLAEKLGPYGNPIGDKRVRRAQKAVSSFKKVGPATLSGFLCEKRVL